MDTFFFLWNLVWFIGGIFFLPFNLQVSLLYACPILGIDAETWTWWRKKAYVIQVVWNLVFFGLQFGYTLTHWATDRVTFTLSREA